MTNFKNLRRDRKNIILSGNPTSLALLAVRFEESKLPSAGTLEELRYIVSLDFLTDSYPDLGTLAKFSFSEYTLDGDQMHISGLSIFSNFKAIASLLCKEMKIDSLYFSGPCDYSDDNICQYRAVKLVNDEVSVTQDLVTVDETQFREVESVGIYQFIQSRINS